MGTEGPSRATTIHVTGFGKFDGVTHNPTERIVSNLKEFMQKKGLPEGLVLGSCNVLEAAGEGGLGPLYEILEAAVNGQGNDNSDGGRVILLHLGLSADLEWFAIEMQAVNEATFSAPDELGWKPQKVPIFPSDGRTSRARETSLPFNMITKSLSEMGYAVTVSDNAGLFVCNYVYYHSLRFAEQHGIKSLFVHVPRFSSITEEDQMEFVAALLEGQGRKHAQALFSLPLLRGLVSATKDGSGSPHTTLGWRPGGGGFKRWTFGVDMVAFAVILMFVRSCRCMRVFCGLTLLL